jgi:glycosyltransferase involved in cell wall biosynthesis
MCSQDAQEAERFPGPQRRDSRCPGPQQEASALETPALSVVLPAYNEAARLPPFLDTVREHLQARYPHAWEVIVVDDGSRDGTAELLQTQLACGCVPSRRDAATLPWPQLSVLTHPVNRGKGAAV